ncbi:MAG: 6-phosphogluconolactonase [Gammaproteobacteria bacterium]|nr:6-phosphogluconolactonase [Gammaproteobacteria bacterium]MBU1491094.1 6-phosphogluconolactonase [Gammaproteobacteria bacterium]MBU2065857.1 6-phosphogluconolactonase [Gammaproteobacteria bacterium]MBU2141183.1 6-phosphogluconolactonase [Gammaproteobacteria bacterium]MBU2215771.1 6-phosphogluconolactonase [Gammaproteobacteria bacterium]
MAISKLDLPVGVLARSLDNPAHLAAALAQRVAEALVAAIDSHGQATLVVSGGRSPIAFFGALAQQQLAWSQVTVSLADERWVPLGHADSNESLVRAHLLQGRAAEARFVGLYQADASLEGAAQKTEITLATLPPIDVLVLGMGDDGHTASLFPGNPLLADALSQECPRSCLPMQAPSSPHQRLSLTLPRLAAARTQLLAIQGPGKLATLTQALAGDDPLQLPIRAFLHAPLEIYWCP